MGGERSQGGVGDAPLRVAQVMGCMDGGGVEQVVMNYYRHIDRSRVQFDFIVNEGSGMVPREEIESLGGRVFMIPDYRHLPAYLSRLGELFCNQGWSIVHSHVNTLSVFPLGVAARTGVPVRIAHSHSTSGGGEHAKNIAKLLLRTQANRYPTHRLACSRYAGEWLFGRGMEFDVIYNAIDLDEFAYDLRLRTDTRAALGLSGDTFVVGHVGRFMPQKNQLFLIDAFADFVAMHQDAALLFVGQGDQFASVERHAIELSLADKVRFLGQRPDVAALYQAFDAFALPSLYEGLGLVGVEAQRAGLPCLLSDAITREVDVTGTCEFLPIDTPKVWAEALARIATAPAPDRYLSGMDGCFGSYDIGRAALGLAGYYERLCTLAGGERG